MKFIVAFVLAFVAANAAVIYPTVPLSYPGLVAPFTAPLHYKSLTGPVAYPGLYGYGSGYYHHALPYAPIAQVKEIAEPVKIKTVAPIVPAYYGDYQSLYPTYGVAAPWGYTGAALPVADAPAEQPKTEPVAVESA